MSALHSFEGDTDAALAKLAQVEFVVTDCDGTLLYTDKTLGQRAIDSVRRLKQVGVQFPSPAAGREGSCGVSSMRRWTWIHRMRRITAAVW